jgi:hypothetical protein
VLAGWRESTIDVDLRFEPEADELLRALPALKESLGLPGDRPVRIPAEARRRLAER